MTQATADASVRQPPLRALGTFVARRVTAWQRDYIRRRPEALATLAQLRRGVGKDAGSVPALWRYTLEGLPEDSHGGTAPSVDEQAAHTALTLFAVHQQSRQEEMHLPGQSLGTAVRQLRSRAASADAVRRRFEALGTAEAFSEVVHHARGLITQLRAHRIPLDYGRFADDLVRLQTGGASRVRLRWGRDFYRQHSETGSTDGADGANDQAAEAAPTDNEAA